VLILNIFSESFTTDKVFRENNIHNMNLMHITENFLILILINCIFKISAAVLAD
jgi:hypothetical protein